MYKVLMPNIKPPI